MLMLSSVFIAEAHVWVKEYEFKIFVSGCGKKIICDLTEGLVFI